MWAECSTELWDLQIFWVPCSPRHSESSAFFLKAKDFENLGEHASDQ